MPFSSKSAQTCPNRTLAISCVVKFVSKTFFMKQINKAERTSVILNKQQIIDQTNAAWLITEKFFYPVAAFSENQESEMRQFIRNFMLRPGWPYDEFCVRALLFREYLIENPHHQVSALPTAWLKDKHGFPLSETWYKALVNDKSEESQHIKNLRVFPEAVLEITYEPNKHRIDYWVKWFKDRDGEDQLQMLVEVARHFNYKIRGI